MNAGAGLAGYFADNCNVCADTHRLGAVEWSTLEGHLERCQKIPHCHPVVNSRDFDQRTVD